MLPSDFAHLFQFNVIPKGHYSDHLPSRITSQVQDLDIVVFGVSDDDSDTIQFSTRYGFSLEDCANTIVLRYKKDGSECHAAIVTLGSRRLDVNGAVKNYLGAKRLSFAKQEVAVEMTGMEFGGITAFGLPTDMAILIDAAVMERPYVVMGAGVRKTKLLLNPALLNTLPLASVAPLTFP